METQSDRTGASLDTGNHTKAFFIFLVSILASHCRRRESTFHRRQ